MYQDKDSECPSLTPKAQGTSQKREQKESSSQKMGRNTVDAIFSTWHSHCTIGVTYKRLATTSSQINAADMGKGSTPEKLLVDEGCWGRGSHFSLEVWLLIAPTVMHI